MKNIDKEELRARLRSMDRRIARLDRHLWYSRLYRELQDFTKTKSYLRLEKRRGECDEKRKELRMKLKEYSNAGV